MTKYVWIKSSFKSDDNLFKKVKKFAINVYEIEQEELGFEAFIKDQIRENDKFFDLKVFANLLKNDEDWKKLMKNIKNRFEMKKTFDQKKRLSQKKERLIKKKTINSNDDLRLIIVERILSHLTFSRLCCVCKNCSNEFMKNVNDSMTKLIN